MTVSSKIRSIVLHPALLCALALAGCVAMADPVVAMGMNDDWSYMWSARALAATGHIVYNGWATAILGWQLYWGAAFIKVFGFSFTGLRVSMLLVSMGTVALIQRLLVRLGASAWNSVVATLTMALSPLFLPLEFSFMTDVPGFFCVLVCVYGCLRAMKAKSDPRALGWLAFAALSNVGLGTVRQVAWLGALVMVPSVCWWMRRRRGAVATGMALWVVSVAAIFGCMHWFSLQPYNISEKVLAKAHTRAMTLEVAGFLRNCLDIVLFVLPVLVAFLQGRARREGRGGRVLAGGVLVGVAAGLAMAVRRRAWSFLAPFSQNYVTAKGLVDFPAVLGLRPDVLPVWVRVGLTAVTIFALVGFGVVVWRGRREQRAPGSVGRLSWGAVGAILGPFAVAYLGLLATRGAIYDRYLLPLVFGALVVIVRVYEDQLGGRLPWLCVGVIAVFAGFGVAGLHDVFALDRARVAAADEVQAAGVPRSKIQAGFDYDSWTQLEQWGYENDERLLIPAGAYRPWTAAKVPAECVAYQASKTPSVEGAYGLSYGESTCLGPAGFAGVRVRTWMPPYGQRIWVVKLR